MEIEFLRTSDLDMAATLLSVGFPIDGIYAKDGTQRLEFYFKKTEALDKAISDYWGRRLRVEPLELLGARKEILTRMKQETYA